MELKLKGLQTTQLIKRLEDAVKLQIQRGKATNKDLEKLIAIISDDTKLKRALFFL